MRKGIALIFLSAFFMAEMSAQVCTGLDGGFNRTMDSLTNLKDKDYSIEQTGNLFMAEAGYGFNLHTGLAGFRNIELVAGIKAGALHLLTTKSKDGATTFTLQTFPLIAFVRAETKYAYLDAGIGMHFWDLKYTADSTNLDNGGAGFTLYLSSGPCITVFDTWTIRAGPSLSYFSIPDIGTGASGNSLSLGALAGISYSFR